MLRRSEGVVVDAKKLRAWPCEPSFGCVWRFPFTRTKMTRLSYPNQREKICGPKGAVFPRLCAWWLGLAHRESICRRNVILPIIHQLPLQHLERAILTWLSALHCHRSHRMEPRAMSRLCL